MRLFAVRVMAIGILVVLYAVNPTLGVGALLAGFGYVMMQRVVRATAN